MQIYIHKYDARNMHSFKCIKYSICSKSISKILLFSTHSEKWVKTLLISIHLNHLALMPFLELGDGTKQEANAGISHDCYNYLCFKRIRNFKPAFHQIKFSAYILQSIKAFFSLFFFLKPLSEVTTLLILVIISRVKMDI